MARIIVMLLNLWRIFPGLMWSKGESRVSQIHDLTSVLCLKKLKAILQIIKYLILLCF